MIATTAAVAVAREHTAGYDPGPVGDTPDSRPAGDRVADAVAAIVVTDRPRTGGDGELAELSATLRAADRLLARAVTLAGELDGRRAAREEGMTVDAALRLHSGAAPVDVATVLTAGQVLRQMPAVAGLFASGVLSWGHVRALTAGARRFDAATRTTLDADLGGQTDRLSRLDPDRQLWALDDAIDRHRRDRTVQARTERQGEHEFLALQGRLDGTGSLYGESAPSRSRP